MVFNEIQAGFDVPVLELDEVEPSRDLLLDRDLVQRVSFGFVLHRQNEAQHSSSVRRNNRQEIRTAIFQRILFYRMTVIIPPLNTP